MAVTPESLNNPKLVRNLLENARRAKRDDLAFNSHGGSAQFVIRHAGEFWPEAASTARGRPVKHGVDPLKIWPNLLM
jgi:hypothetical protein